MSKNLVLTVLFMAFCTIIQAQNVQAYRYWFDEDDANAVTVSIDSVQWSFSPDVSQMTSTAHTLHFQYQDTAGVWSSAQSMSFLKMPAQSDSLYYWFDDSDEIIYLDDQTVSHQLDASQLSTGLHYVTFQYIMSGGRTSNTSTYTFYKSLPSEVNVTYWFDEGSAKYDITPDSTVQQIDVSNLSVGVHTLFCQSSTSDGSMNSLQTATFVKMPATAIDSAYICYLVMDGKTTQSMPLESNSGLMQWNADVSSLEPGLHEVTAFIKTAQGVQSQTKQAWFYRPFTAAECSGLQCMYSIDGQPYETSSQLTDSTTFYFQLDVNQYSPGLHQLSVMLTDGDSIQTDVRTAHFYNASDKYDGLALVDYNLNESAIRDTVNIPQQANPIIDNLNLAVDTMPFCSKRFHFEIADSLPMVYSQNDIHTTFTNFHGLTADTSAHYTEYRVSRPVTATGYLRGFSGEVSACINDNQIVWYFLPCTAGDSVSLRTSQDADLHTFSPSGKETIFRTGQQATSYSSFTAEETGYYYIGIHDVTGASKTTALHYIRGVPRKNHFQLTYMVDSQVYMTDSIAYGIHPDTICAPSKEGYTFCKWNDLPDLMPAHDVSVEGYFTVNSYILTYLVDGMPYGCDTILFCTAPTPLPEPVKEGYTFCGWSEIPATMPAHDVNITGSFSINSYILTYFVDEDFLVTEQYCYGDTIHLIETLQREGCTFSGWDVTDVLMPAHDITANGHFIPNVYLLKYLIDEVFFLSDSIAFGSTIPAIAHPELEGHYFSDWVDLPDVMPAHDVTVNGHFCIESYILTYIIDDEIYSAQSVAYHDSIAPMSTPSKAGSTFSGWQGEPVIMPAHDVTVSGTFITGEASATLPEAPFEVYNLQGLLILRHASEKDLMSLPRGLYIANGQIIMVNK